MFPIIITSKRKNRVDILHKSIFLIKIYLYYKEKTWPEASITRSIMNIKYFIESLKSGYYFIKRSYNFSIEISSY